MEKKKIALIIDTEGWAFDNIAHQLKNNLTEFDIDIIPGRIFEGNMIKLFLFGEDYDLMHFLWRGYLTLIDRDEMHNYIEALGMSFEKFKQKYILNKNITFSVCDELYLSGDDEWRTEETMKYGKEYFVTSKRLYNIYQQFSKKPQMVIHDGVDLQKYIPENLDRFKNIETVRIGWTGNSKFKDSEGDSDMKGVEGIIKPAIEELQREGYSVELNLADRNIKMIPQEEMPKFYNSIDLYVCASKTEGTPLPIIEAMAMGVPVISTDVGIVSEAVGECNKKYILKERTKEDLKNAIKSIIKNKQDFEEISKENIEKVKQWDWKVIAQQYKEFFESNM